jgi:hypothetical protein
MFVFFEDELSARRVPFANEKATIQFLIKHLYVKKNAVAGSLLYTTFWRLHAILGPGEDDK